MQQLPTLSEWPTYTSFVQRSDSDHKQRKYHEYLQTKHFHYVRKPYLKKKH